MNRKWLEMEQYGCPASALSAPVVPALHTVLPPILMPNIRGGVRVATSVLIQRGNTEVRQPSHLGVIQMAEEHGRRDHRYATFMEETGTALEFAEDGAGIGWATGYDGQIWFIRNSTDEPGTIPEDVFEDALLEMSTVVMDTRELPAFRELVE